MTAGRGGYRPAKHVVPIAVARPIEQGIARGEDEATIAKTVGTDVATVRRVRAAMDEANYQ